MSCFVKQIKSCEIFGDTINSRIFSFDISVKKVNALIQKNDSLNITHKILEINDNKHILNIEDLNLIIGNYKITYIFEILINGKQIKKTFCIEELVIKKAGCNCNEVINELNFIINLEEINIPVNIDLSITNINGQGGDLSWGNINGNIENQADLIQKFGDYYTKIETYNKNEVNSLISNIDVDVDLSNYYTKPQSDSRFKSISYTPNWSEVSGKPTTFTPSAHTHTIAEIDNLQNTLANKVDKVIGKQLSTEDYTTAEKNKLAGIQEGAEANVNADWNATSGDAKILNLPSTFTPSLHTHSISEVDNLQNTLDGKEQKISTGTTSQYWRGDKTWQTLDKNAVGLSNVDNTSDANKPISNATQTALNSKIDKITTGSVRRFYGVDTSNNQEMIPVSDFQQALGFNPENNANKATDFSSPNNTKYPTTLAVANENKKATITVELISQLTTNFYAPNALRINSTALISGSGTLTLKVNDVAYTLGSLIPQGAKITAETTSASVYNLISIYE